VKIVKVYFPVSADSDHYLVERFGRVCSKLFGGCTTYKAQGYWADRSGIETHVFEIAIPFGETITKKLVLSVANRYILGTAKQQSYLVSWPDGEAQFVDQGDWHAQVNF
jgi:hypothetical protein